MIRKTYLWMPLPAFALLACAAWYFARGGVEVQLPPNEEPAALQPAPAPPKITPPAHKAVPAKPDKPLPVLEAPAPGAEPRLHKPDHGERIWRGGARVDFELFDADGNPAVAQDFTAVLWRQVGRYWLLNQAVAGEGNLLHCEGLAHTEAHATGLEPGWYELELLSETWGNLRHRFQVRRGEQRLERVMTPNARRVVCVRYLHPDGKPVQWLPHVPSLSADSVALDGVDRGTPEFLTFRKPPTVLGGTIGGGGGWGGSTYRRTSRRGAGPTLYATDDGRWWFVAYAGANNKITARLVADGWGAEESIVTETFLATSEVTVTLETPVDFAERAKAFSDKVSSIQPGQRERREPAPLPQPAVDPTQPPANTSFARLTIELGQECGVDVQLSLDGSNAWRTCDRQGRYRWMDMAGRTDYWFRFADGSEVLTEWEKVHVSPGVNLLARQVPGHLLTIEPTGLTPTLAAFAHAARFTVTIPAAIEDPKIVEGATDEGNDEIVEEPTEAPHPYDPNKEPDLPAGRSRALTLLVSQHERRLQSTRRVSAQTWQALQGQDLRAQTILLGTCLTRRPISGGYNTRADTPKPYTHDWLAGGWIDATNGRLQLGAERAFVLRAVGPSDEGLPWVRGLVMEHAHDEVASRVRELLAALPADRRPLIRWDDHTAYAARLAEVEEAHDEAGLRQLLGEAYDLLETDGQRLWLARNGTWYEASRQLRTDLDGYMVSDGKNLEPGKVYVLYLWSNSRDDARPDRRVVFKADNVTDLGVIDLPAYVD